MRFCPLADDGLQPPWPAEPNHKDPQQVADADHAWSTQTDACSGRRVALAVALTERLRAPVDMAAVLHPLTPPERGALVHRLGWGNVWSPMRPDGLYLLDLAVREDRRVAKALVHLEAAELGSALVAMHSIDTDRLDDEWLQRDLPIDEERVTANVLWRHVLPKAGVYSFKFKSASNDTHDVSLALRTALATLTSSAPPTAFPALSGIETATLWGRHSHTREPLNAVEFACQSRDKVHLDPDIFNWEITGPGTT